MAMILKDSVQTKSPPEKVWTFIADPEQMKPWNPKARSILRCGIGSRCSASAELTGHRQTGKQESLWGERTFADLNEVRKSRLRRRKRTACLDKFPITISIGQAGRPALHGSVTRHGRHQIARHNTQRRTSIQNPGVGRDRLSVERVAQRLRRAARHQKDRYNGQK